MRAARLRLWDRPYRKQLGMRAGSFLRPPLRCFTHRYQLSAWIMEWSFAENKSSALQRLCNDILGTPRGRSGDGGSSSSHGMTMFRWVALHHFGRSVLALPKSKSIVKPDK